MRNLFFERFIIHFCKAAIYIERRNTMGRALTYNEKNKINQICKSQMALAITYGNVAKIISPIVTISVFLFLYFDMSLGYIWIYLGIGILLSIIEIIEITKIQLPYLAIKNDNCACIESKMLSNRLASRSYSYYVTVNIEGEVKEIEYKGQEFDYLTIGEEMLIIQFKGIKKDIQYICFSKKEIDAQPYMD